MGLKITWAILVSPTGSVINVIPPPLAQVCERVVPISAGRTAIRVTHSMIPVAVSSAVQTLLTSPLTRFLLVSVESNVEN